MLPHKKIIVSVVISASSLILEPDQLEELGKLAKVCLVLLGTAALSSRDLGGSIVHARLEAVKASKGVVRVEFMGDVPPELSKKEGVKGVVSDPEWDSGIRL